MSAFAKKTQHIAAAFEAGYNKDNLYQHFLVPFRPFIRQNADFFKTEGAEPDVLAAALSTKVPNKAMTADICAMPFCSKAAYKRFLAYLPDDVRQVWNLLVWEERLSESEIEAQIGIKVTSLGKTAYGREEHRIRPGFEIFTGKEGRYYSWRISEQELFLPFPLREALIEYYELPPEATLSPIAEPPAAEHCYCTGERDILLELPRLLTYKKQGQINYTAKNRPAQTGLGKVQRSLNLNEFFPAASHKRLKHLRTGLLAGMAVYMPNQKLPEYLPEFIRHLFAHSYPTTAVTAPIVLTDIKGMGTIDDYYFKRTEPDLIRLLRSLPASAWVSFDNILAHIRYSLYRLQPMSIHLATDKLYYDYPTEIVQGKYAYIQSNRTITNAMFREAVENPFLCGSFFLFAAFGLCDIAYDTPEVDDLGGTCYSSWEGIRYVRRTALGDYVCGLAEHYEAQQETAISLALSPDTLMIAATDTDTAAAAVLEPYTERVGANRFRTDSQIFLKNIKSKKELMDKITLFKQVVGSELPLNWQGFFQEMLHKINPFVREIDMTVLRIPPDNTALIRLVAQDPVLRKLVVKAEGFLILVPQGNMAPLRRRLQEFGYLLTQ
ncbi:MAG: hypothetical protein ABMA02_04275 [Saprospiraceae bacterium]